MKHILLFFIIIATPAFGQQLRHLSLDVGKFYNNRDPYWPSYHLIQETPAGGSDEAWNHHLSLNLDMTLIDFGPVALRWDQHIIGNSTTRQYREVAWAWRMSLETKGFPLSPFWDHQSRHFLEGFQESGYPLRDVYGVSLCLYGCQGGGK